MPASDECSPADPHAGTGVGRPVPRPAGGTEAPAPRASRLWIWFVAAFALQLLAWAAWLTIASHHRVQEVPIVPVR